ncbi:MAG: GntR family transcriptional regulator [Armatimonadetes bacterium]|nr:GntR family transcriptional regulator [Armatimonadota bacterium]
MVLPSPYRTKADLAFSLLRQAIKDGRLQPGTPLRQRQLAESLGMSLTPVREAIRRLEAEGLLKGTPHTTLRVKDVSSRQVKEVYAIRNLLESYAARMAALHLTGAQIAELDHLFTRMKQALRRRQLPRIRALDEAFHMLLYAAAGNELLLEIISHLWTKFPRDTLWTIPGRAAKSLGEHAGILRAIHGGKGALVGDVIVTHIKSSEESILQYLAGSEDAQTSPPTHGRPEKGGSLHGLPRADNVHPRRPSHATGRGRRR